MKTARPFLAALSLTALFAASVWAGPVDTERARRMGASFAAARMGADAKAELKLVYQINGDASGLPAIYFFNVGNSGFVMVSGSDRIDPIVGFSDSHPFDPTAVPPAMLAFLHRHVEAVEQAERDQTLAMHTKWQGDASAWCRPTKEEAVTLTTSLWHQVYPYNEQVPVVGNEHVPTGCVATSLAQLLYYWKWPTRGEGSVNYLGTGVDYGLSARFDSTDYRYDLMTDQMDNVRGADSVDAVALLNSHCGIAVRTIYGTDGSGSHTDRWMLQVLKNNFKYDRHARRLTRESLGTGPAADTAWADSLKADIYARRPIIYSAYDLVTFGGRMGHCFLCDGYDPATDMFRFNWGFGFMNATCWCNVYTSQLLVDGMNFSADHTAYLGVQPRRDDLGIADAEGGATRTLEVYPNPAHSTVSVVAAGATATGDALRVLDAAGRVVLSQPLPAGLSHTTLNVSTLPAGVYVVRWGEKAEKLIVNR